MYFMIKWLCTAIVRSLFRQVTVINAERIPLYGPVIFVGNHNNQFIDPVLLVAIIPREVKFLVAEKSTRRRIIGRLSRAAGSIAVKRPDDMIYDGLGNVIWDMQSCKLYGKGTRFSVDFRENDKIILSEVTIAVAVVLSDTELILENELTVECEDKINGVSFKVLPKVDQSEVYNAVNEHLKAGDTIGIFPEGGSHDRTTLLPLKAGVAIMSLCSVLDGAEDVMIVPIGLTYHEAHKFQSCATLRVGLPIPVSYELALEYQKDRRTAISKLIKEVEEGMLSCIITAQDHNTMSYIKLCCSLFPPERLTLTEAKYHDLHQLFSKLFWQCSSEEGLKDLMNDLKAYQCNLEAYGIPDNEVWMLKHSTRGATLSFVEKFGTLLFSATVGIPIAFLWGPVGFIAYHLAERHRAEALANSKVKIKGTDVLASYKVMVLLVLLPTVNILYGLLFGIVVFETMLQIFLSMIFCLCILPAFYYISLQHCGRLTSLVRQLKTLIYVIIGKINVWRDTERKLITNRTEMQLKVRKVAYDLGSSVSDNFLQELWQTVPKAVLDMDSKRLIHKKDYWIPIESRNYLENREEIL